MADVVLNPVIPYSGHIHGGIFQNKTIYVQGSVPPHSDRFSVNLQCGVGTNEPNIAFHFNPRFECQNQVVVCNTKTNQQWGQEERHRDDFPFEQGKSFQLVILCELNEFKVAVNGRYFAEYKYRVANLHEITGIYVKDCVHIDSIRYDPPLSGSYLGQQGIQLINPPCPYNGPIGAAGLQYGTIITVKLTVNPNPNRFAINLNGAYYGPQQDDIALHFNPRFCERVIVRNSKRSQKWGSEERDGTFPFAPNGTHEVTILCMKKSYRVQVDGHHVTVYIHRHDAQTVKSMTVSGDVSIREINID